MPDELAAAKFDGARIREIVDEISDRQQTIVKLRFFFDRPPEEIQSCLGISERAYGARAGACDAACRRAVRAGPGGPLL